MKIELPPLPYGDGDLAPHISANTISFHYGKHHKTYVDKATDMVKGTEFADASLEDIVKATFGKADKKGLFNNASQAWNHSFYWKSLTPKGGAPSGKLLDKIKTDFGELAKLKDELSKAAVTQFGSGWAWLVLDGGKLKVEQTANADSPLATGKTPLLTIDVWEHAYYLDHQNKRPAYVTAVIDNLIN
ncbi:MAG: superoxide dismutase, partial [Acidobacteriota bacterium]